MKSIHGIAPAHASGSRIERRTASGANNPAQKKSRNPRAIY